MTMRATTWSTRPLADVADLSLGKMLDQNKNRGEYLPYLANVNVRWGSFDLSSLREMRFESHERTRYGLQFGDIVMCEGGEPGRCALWRDERPGMMIQKALHRIRTRDGLDNRFLYYSLLHRGRTGVFASLFTGATIKHLPGQNLAKICVALPPLPMQVRIADILSAYDDLIENNRRRIRYLEQQARLIYEEWFVRFRFPGHEGARISGRVPNGWKTERLSEIARITMGQSPKSIHYNREGNGLPFHQGVTNFDVRFPIHDVYCTEWKRIAEAGDILFSVRAPVGRINISLDKIVIGRGVAAIRSQRGQQSVLFYALKNHFVRMDMMGSGAIFAAITRKDLHGVPLLQPPSQLAERFTELVRPIDLEIACLQRSIDGLTKARDLLLPRLMSGELPV